MLVVQPNDTSKPVSREFITAGKAIFTIEVPAQYRLKDGPSHYTFRVDRVDGSDRWPTTWFVKLLTGPDNETSYTYFGKLDDFTGQVKTTAKSEQFANSFALKLLNRVLARIWSDDHAAYEQFGFRTHHEGRCCRCGRTLTTPESVERGIGPECIKHM